MQNISESIKVKRMSFQLRVLLPLAATIVLIAAGCGGGSDGGSDGGNGGGGAPAGESAPSSASDNGGEASAGTEADADGASADSNSSDAEEGSSAAPDPAFVKQVNTICLQGKESLGPKMEAYEKEHEGEDEEVPGELQVMALTSAFFPKLEEEIEEFDALGAERGEEEEIAPYIEALESGLEGDAPTSLVELLGKFKAADELGRRYGFKACLVS
jgi:hypothetical protein